MATPKNLITYLLLSLIVVGFLSACGTANNSTKSQVPEKQAVFATVIDYSEVSGCGYMLELSDGKKLQPLNLADEYRRIGLKLFITYKIEDGVGVCMAGSMVTLTSVSMAKEDKQR